MDKISPKMLIGLRVPAFFQYWYIAKVESVYDGDSITVELDFGMNKYEKHVKVRLLNLNADEIRGINRENGLRIRDIVRNLLPVGSEIWINTYKDRREKHGRLLAIVFKGDFNLNQWLLDHNYADPYPKPKTPAVPPEVTRIYVGNNEEPIYTKDEDNDGTDGTPI